MSDQPAAVFTVSKEMGVNHKDFFRFLGRVVPMESCLVEGRRITIPGEGKMLELEISAEKERVLSPVVKMAYTEVRLKFSGYSEQEKEDFLWRFKLAFHRGGG